VRPAAGAPRGLRGLGTGARPPQPGRRRAGPEGRPGPGPRLLPLPLPPPPVALPLAACGDTSVLRPSRPGPAAALVLSPPLCPLRPPWLAREPAVQTSSAGGNAGFVYPTSRHAGACYCVLWRTSIFNRCMHCEGRC
jgi:hypothetical protein